MANLVEVAEELEYVPKDQLVQMAQDPNSRFPSYMVLSEIQRRTQMERMYNAQRAERPTSTVAEELVGEFAQPQGLAGMSADGLGPQPNDFSLSAAPASSPMQMAAGGGRTGYQNLGATGNARLQLLTSLGIDPTGMSEEQIQQALMFATQEQPEQAPLPQVDTGVDRPVDLRSVEAAPVSTEQESSLYDNVMGGLVSAGKFTGVLDEEGEIDPVGAGLAALSMIPAVRAGRFAYGLGAKYLPSVGRFASRPFTTAKRTVTSKKGKTYDADSPEGRMIQNLSKKKPTVKETRVFSPKKTLETAGTVALPAAVLKNVSDYAQENLPPTETKGLAGAIQDEDADNQIIEEKIKQITGGEENKTSKGLLGKINSYMDQADGLDIAKLGGIIMGAKNMSELGAGITALASDVQDRKTAEQAREDTLKLQGIQGDLYQAQTEKYKADVESMPYDRLVAEFNAVADAYKLLAEQGDPSDPELAEYATYLGMLRKQMAAIRGIETNEQSDADLLAAAGISVSG